MSTSLVRKGLDLFSDDNILDKRQKPKGKKMRLSSTKRSDLMSVISTNKKGVKKQLKRLKERSNPKQKATVKDKKIKSAFDKIHKDQTQDMTEKNLQYLLRSSQNRRFTTQISDKILQYSRGRLAKDNPIITEKKTEDTSVFSEEDFKKFEEEYRGRTSHKLIEPVSRKPKRRR